MALFVGGVQIGPGKPGKDGAPGPTNNLTVSGVETLQPGQPAEVIISGTSPNQQITFKIPKGDIGATGLDWKGPWDAAADYVVDDVVSYDGNSYFCLAANTNSAPTGLSDDPNWAVLSLRGGAGPANVLTIGTVDTLSPGESASATITGTSPSQTLNLAIPAGADGAPAVITVGTVETLPAGEPATVQLVDDATGQTINFGLPRGIAISDEGSVGQVATMGRRQSVAQTMASSVNTVLLYDTLDASESNNQDATGVSYANGRVTNITTDTVTLKVSTQNHFASNTTGVRYAWLQKSDGTRIGQAQAVGAAGGQGSMVGVSTQVVLAPGEYFDFMGWQNSGSALAVNGGGTGLAAGYAGRAVITRMRVTGDNSIAIGTVTTGASGSSAAAAINGTAPNQTLDLTIPVGADGKSAYQSWLDAGNTGTEADFLASLTPDSFQLDIFNWSGSQDIANAAFLNLLSLAGITKQTGGTAGLSLSAGLLKFPARIKPSGVTFTIRITGTVGGNTGTAREWKIQTRRPDAVTVVGSASTVKVFGADISNRDTVLRSYTSGVADPFTAQGIMVGLQNDSGQTITLTLVSIRVDRNVNAE
nr:hypothetical protein EATA8330_27390 [Enterobacter asburiae]